MKIQLHTSPMWIPKSTLVSYNYTNKLKKKCETNILFNIKFINKTEISNIFNSPLVNHEQPL